MLEGRYELRRLTSPCFFVFNSQCLLHFHIMNRKLLWSELFEKVQKLKKAFDFEDVVVSDSSLEQMFFALTETKAPLTPTIEP